MGGEKLSCLNLYNSPCQGPRPPIAKILVDELFLGFAIQGSAQWTFATQSSKFRSVEFERNDPMAIFEEEELVVDKGMTHM